MFEAIVERMLLKYLAPYVDGISRENLKMGIWSGDLTLENLSVKPQISEIFDFPMKVIGGTVKKIKVTLPWQSLLTSNVKPMIVDIQSVHVRLGPKKDKKKTDEELVREAERAKHLRIEMREDQLEEFEESRKIAQAVDSPQGKGGDAKQQQQQSWSLKILNKLLSMMQVDVTDVHVTFEDDEHCFLGGAVLTSLNIHSTNSLWQRVVEEKQMSFETLFKMAQVAHFGVYCNVRPRETPKSQQGALEDEKEKGQEGAQSTEEKGKETAEEDPAVAQAKIAAAAAAAAAAGGAGGKASEEAERAKQAAGRTLKEIQEIDKLPPPKDRHYLLKPLTVTLRLEHHAKDKKAIVRLELGKETEGVALTRTQLRTLLVLSQEAAEHQTHVRRLTLRGTETFRLDPEGLHTETRRLFFALYSKELYHKWKLKSEKLTREEAERLRRLHLVIGTRHLARWRLQCRNTARKVLEAAAAKRKSRGQPLPPQLAQILQEQQQKRAAKGLGPQKETGKGGAPQPQQKQGWLGWLTGRKEAAPAGSGTPAAAASSSSTDALTPSGDPEGGIAFSEDEIKQLTDSLENDQVFAHVDVPTRLNFNFSLPRFAVELLDDGDREGEGEATGPGGLGDKSGRALTGSERDKGKRDGASSRCLLSIVLYRFDATVETVPKVDRNDRDNSEWKFLSQIEHFFATHKDTVIVEFRQPTSTAGGGTVPGFRPVSLAEGEGGGRKEKEKQRDSALELKKEHKPSLSVLPSHPFADPVFRRIQNGGAWGGAPSERGSGPSGEAKRAAAAETAIGQEITDKGNILKVVLRLNPLWVGLRPDLSADLIRFFAPPETGPVSAGPADTTLERVASPLPAGQQPALGRRPSLLKGRSGSFVLLGEDEKGADPGVDMGGAGGVPTQQQQQQGLVDNEYVQDVLDQTRDQLLDFYSRNEFRMIPDQISVDIVLAGPILYLDTLDAGMVQLHSGTCVLTTGGPCDYSLLNLSMNLKETQVKVITPAVSTQTDMPIDPVMRARIERKATAEGTAGTLKGGGRTRRHKTGATKEVILLRPIPVHVRACIAKMRKANLAFFLDEIWVEASPEALQTLLAVPPTLIAPLSRLTGGGGGGGTKGAGGGPSGSPDKRATVLLKGEAGAAGGAGPPPALVLDSAGGTSGPTPLMSAAAKAEGAQGEAAGTEVTESLQKETETEKVEGKPAPEKEMERETDAAEEGDRGSASATEKEDEQTEAGGGRGGEESDANELEGEMEAEVEAVVDIAGDIDAALQNAEPEEDDDAAATGGRETGNEPAVAQGVTAVGASAGEGEGKKGPPSGGPGGPGRGEAEEDERSPGGLELEAFVAIQHAGFSVFLLGGTEILRLTLSNASLRGSVCMGTPEGLCVHTEMGLEKIESWDPSTGIPILLTVSDEEGAVFGSPDRQDRTDTQRPVGGQSEPSTALAKRTSRARKTFFRRVSLAVFARRLASDHKLPDEDGDEEKEKVKEIPPGALPSGVSKRQSVPTPWDIFEKTDKAEEAAAAAAAAAAAVAQSSPVSEYDYDREEADRDEDDDDEFKEALEEWEDVPNEGGPLAPQGAGGESAQESGAPADAPLIASPTPTQDVPEASEAVDEEEDETDDDEFLDAEETVKQYLVVVFSMGEVRKGRKKGKDAMGSLGVGVDTMNTDKLSVGENEALAAYNLRVKMGKMQLHWHSQRIRSIYGALQDFQRQVEGAVESSRVAEKFFSQAAPPQTPSANPAAAASPVKNLSYKKSMSTGVDQQMERQTSAQLAPSPSQQHAASPSPEGAAAIPPTVQMTAEARELIASGLSKTDTEAPLPLLSDRNESIPQTKGTAVEERTQSSSPSTKKKNPFYLHLSCEGLSLSFWRETKPFCRMGLRDISATSVVLPDGDLTAGVEVGGGVVEMHNRCVMAPRRTDEESRLLVIQTRMYGRKSSVSMCMRGKLWQIEFLFYRKELDELLDYLQDDIVNAFVTRSYQAVKAAASTSYFLFSFSIESPLIHLPDDKVLVQDYVDGVLQRKEKRRGMGGGVESDGGGGGPSGRPLAALIEEEEEDVGPTQPKEKEKDGGQIEPDVEPDEGGQARTSSDGGGIFGDGQGEKNGQPDLRIDKSLAYVVNLKQSVDLTPLEDSIMTFDLGSLSVSNAYAFPEAQPRLTAQGRASSSACLSRTTSQQRLEKFDGAEKEEQVGGGDGEAVESLSISGSEGETPAAAFRLEIQMRNMTIDLLERKRESRRGGHSKVTLMKKTALDFDLQTGNPVVCELNFSRFRLLLPRSALTTVLDIVNENILYRGFSEPLRMCEAPYGRLASARVSEVGEEEEEPQMAAQKSAPAKGECVTTSEGQGPTAEDEEEVDEDESDTSLGGEDEEEEEEPPPFRVVVVLRIPNIELESGFGEDLPLACLNLNDCLVKFSADFLPMMMLYDFEVQVNSFTVDDTRKASENVYKRFVECFHCVSEAYGDAESDSASVPFSGGGGPMSTSTFANPLLQTGGGRNFRTGGQKERAASHAGGGGGASPTESSFPVPMHAGGTATLPAGASRSGLFFAARQSFSGMQVEVTLQNPTICVLLTLSLDLAAWGSQGWGHSTMSRIFKIPIEELEKQLRGEEGEVDEESEDEEVPSERPTAEGGALQGRRSSLVSSVEGEREGGPRPPQAMMLHVHIVQGTFKMYSDVTSKISPIIQGASDFELRMQLENGAYSIEQLDLHDAVFRRIDIQEMPAASGGGDASQSHSLLPSRLNDSLLLSIMEEEGGEEGQRSPEREREREAGNTKGVAFGVSGQRGSRGSTGNRLTLDIQTEKKRMAASQATTFGGGLGFTARSQVLLCDAFSLKGSGLYLTAAAAPPPGSTLQANNRQADGPGKEAQAQGGSEVSLDFRMLPFAIRLSCRDLKTLLSAFSSVAADQPSVAPQLAPPSQTEALPAYARPAAVSFDPQVQEVHPHSGATQATGGAGGMRRAGELRDRSSNDKEVAETPMKLTVRFSIQGVNMTVLDDLRGPSVVPVVRADMAMKEFVYFGGADEGVTAYSIIDLRLQLLYLNPKAGEWEPFLERCLLSLDYSVFSDKEYKRILKEFMRSKQKPGGGGSSSHSSGGSSRPRSAPSSSHSETSASSSQTHYSSGRGDREKPPPKTSVRLFSGSPLWMNITAPLCSLLLWFVPYFMQNIAGEREKEKEEDGKSSRRNSAAAAAGERKGSTGKGDETARDEAPEQPEAFEDAMEDQYQNSAFRCINLTTQVFDAFARVSRDTAPADRGDGRSEWGGSASTRSNMKAREREREMRAKSRPPHLQLVPCNQEMPLDDLVVGGVSQEAARHSADKDKFLYLATRVPESAVTDLAQMFPKVPRSALVTELFKTRSLHATIDSAEKGRLDRAVPPLEDCVETRAVVVPLSRRAAVHPHLPLQPIDDVGGNGRYDDVLTVARAKKEGANFRPRYTNAFPPICRVIAPHPTHKLVLISSHVLVFNKSAIPLELCFLDKGMSQIVFEANPNRVCESKILLPPQVAMLAGKGGDYSEAELSMPFLTEIPGYLQEEQTASNRLASSLILPHNHFASVPEEAFIGQSRCQILFRPAAISTGNAVAPDDSATFRQGSPGGGDGGRAGGGGGTSESPQYGGELEDIAGGEGWTNVLDTDRNLGTQVRFSEFAIPAHAVSSGSSSSGGRRRVGGPGGGGGGVTLQKLWFQVETVSSTSALPAEANTKEVHIFPAFSLVNATPVPLEAAIRHSPRESAGGPGGSGRTGSRAVGGQAGETLFTMFPHSRFNVYELFSNYSLDLKLALTDFAPQPQERNFSQRGQRAPVPIAWSDRVEDVAGWKFRPSDNSRERERERAEREKDEPVVKVLVPAPKHAPVELEIYRGSIGLAAPLAGLASATMDFGAGARPMAAGEGRGRDESLEDGGIAGRQLTATIAAPRWFVDRTGLLMKPLGQPDNSGNSNRLLLPPFNNNLYLLGASEKPQIELLLPSEYASRDGQHSQKCLIDIPAVGSFSECEVTGDREVFTFCMHCEQISLGETGGAFSRVVTLLPKYILTNHLDVPVRVKQRQAGGPFLKVLAGATSPVHWRLHSQHTSDVTPTEALSPYLFEIRPEVLPVSAGGAATEDTRSSGSGTSRSNPATQSVYRWSDAIIAAEQTAGVTSMCIPARQNADSHMRKGPLDHMAVAVEVAPNRGVRSVTLRRAGDVSSGVGPQGGSRTESGFVLINKCKSLWRVSVQPYHGDIRPRDSTAITGISTGESVATGSSGTRSGGLSGQHFFCGYGEATFFGWPEPFHRASRAAYVVLWLTKTTVAPKEALSLDLDPISFIPRRFEVSDLDRQGKGGAQRGTKRYGKVVITTERAGDLIMIMVRSKHGSSKERERERERERMELEQLENGGDGVGPRSSLTSADEDYDDADSQYPDPGLAMRKAAFRRLIQNQLRAGSERANFASQVLQVDIGQLGVSLVSDRLREELLFAELSGISLVFGARDDEQNVLFKIRDIQVDSQLEEGGRERRKRPVLLASKEPEKTEFVKVYLERAFVSSAGNFVVKVLEAFVDDLEVDFEDAMLYGIQGFVQECLESLGGTLSKGVHRSDILAWLASTNNLYDTFEPPQVPTVLTIGRLRVHSFIVRIWCALSLRRIQALPDVVRLFLQLISFSGKLTLTAAPLEMTEEVMSEWRGSFTSVSDQLSEAYYWKVMASISSILGHSSLLNLPRLPVEVGKTGASAVFKAASKVTSTTSSLLGHLTFDGEYINRRQKEERERLGGKGPQSMGQGFKQGGKDLAEGVLSLADVFVQPVKGAQKGGVKGFFTGLGKGVMGTIIKPFDKAGQAISSVTGGVSAGLSGGTTSKKLRTTRKRPARMLWGPQGVIREFAVHEAEVRELLTFSLASNLLEFIELDRHAYPGGAGGGRGGTGSRRGSGERRGSGGAGGSISGPSGAAAGAEAAGGGGTPQGSSRHVFRRVLLFYPSRIVLLDLNSPKLAEVVSCFGQAYGQRGGGGMEGRRASGAGGDGGKDGNGGSGGGGGGTHGMGVYCDYDLNWTCPNKEVEDVRASSSGLILKTRTVFLQIPVAVAADPPSVYAGGDDLGGSSSSSSSSSCASSSSSSSSSSAVGGVTGGGGSSASILMRIYKRVCLASNLSGGRAGEWQDSSVDVQGHGQRETKFPIPLALVLGGAGFSGPPGGPVVPTAPQGVAGGGEAGGGGESGREAMENG